MFAIIIQTLCVFAFLLYVMFKGAKATRNTGKFRYCIYSLIIFGIFFGLRFGVGRDTNDYILAYEYNKDGIFSYAYQQFEVGYVWLESVFAKINAPSWFFMGFVSFLQVFLSFYSFKDKKEYLPFLVVTFILGTVWLTYSNTIRQMISFSIFLFSLVFVEKRKWIIHYILLVVAVLFHKSAIVLFILYPLLALDVDWFKSIRFQYVVFFLAIILGRMSFTATIMDYIDQYSSLLEYDYYMDSQSAVYKSVERYGVGYYIGLLIPTILISQSQRLKQFDPRLTMYYNLYFIGTISSKLFLGSMMLHRLFSYFAAFSYIIGAMTLYMLYINNRRQTFYLLLGSYFLIFVGIMYRMFDNDSAFYFIWQTDEYREFSNLNDAL